MKKIMIVSVILAVSR